MNKIKIAIKKTKIKYSDPFKVYQNLSNKGNNISLLMESRALNLKYGRESIIISNPAIKIKGNNENFSIETLNQKGENILKLFNKNDFDYADLFKQTKTKITGIVKKEIDINMEENKRTSQKNISFVLKTILNKFECKNEFCGLYGAFAYDFSKNFYKVNTRFNENTNDFVLFLPTTVYVFNDIKKTAEKINFLFANGEEKSINGFNFKKEKKRIEYDLTDKEYLKSLDNIINDIKNGRTMQCVLSRKISITLQKHPIESYSQLRQEMRAPYSYYFNLGDNEILYGVSPEIHIKIKNNEIEIRPIAGTIQRSSNPLEDSQQRINLLTDEKEKREHTMLVDLVRHELYNLCEPKSMKIDELFILEAYPNLYHLVSDVKGILKHDKNAIDSLLITLPSGTLSGAPKQESMQMIEENEGSKRGYYGGAIGYISFNGECNTGITIRSIHVKNNKSSVRGGGGVTALSTPNGEFEERKLKLENMIKVLG
jgi:anthranilate/para-aminobenzoate synthase component I